MVITQAQIDEWKLRLSFTGAALPKPEAVTLITEIEELRKVLKKSRDDTLKEVMLLVDDFHWTLPMYKSKAANEASDDAAESVKGQICESLRDLRQAAKAGSVE